jgi:hypothetical protein
VQVDIAQVVVVVEPSMLPTGANKEAGGKSTAAADVDPNVVGWYGKEHTPFGTLEKHYRMGLP